VVGAGDTLVGAVNGSSALDLLTGPRIASGVGAGSWGTASGSRTSSVTCLTSTCGVPYRRALERGREVRGQEEEGVMLWTIAVILLVLWALGMGSSYTGGGLVHLLLVVAVIVVVFQFIGGRRSI